MTVRKHIEEGLELAKAGELEKAALSFCQAIKLEANAAEAYQRLGEVLMPLGQWDDAHACFSKAIELDPGYPEAYNYLGVVLKHKGAYAQAEACYREAIRLKNDYPDAIHNLGNCLKMTGRLEEAESFYLQALKLQPDFLQTRFSLGTLYMLQGHYDKGWKLYDSRFDWKGKFRLDIPIWQGEDLTGRKILLFFEQGFGDMIQTVRYAYKVAELASQTTVWLQKPLEKLLADTQREFSVCANSKDLDPAKFDYACSIFSLPAKFGFADGIYCASEPYIKANKEVAKQWRERINSAVNGRLKVGVVWAGNPEHSDDHNRSVPYEVFSRLFQFDNIVWVSLQVGREVARVADDEARLLDYSAEFDDFAQTAGVIENLDLIIAVDTAVAHLAGAMGKKVWLLLPFMPDWRWGLAADTSCWYKDMRLFRQTALGDWQEVLERIENALQNIAAEYEIEQ